MKFKFTSIIFILCIISYASLSASLKEDALFSATNGRVHFVSEAPLELIEAESDDVKGILSSENQSFAFSVSISSFLGFNSPLQQEHFNENYMESDTYEKAIFTGTIIEEIDLFSPGKIKVRAKGKFNIHGVEKVQLLDVNLIIEDGSITVNSSFDILLEDYKIDIPRIVNKKIAKQIHITVDVVLQKR